MLSGTNFAKYFNCYEVNDKVIGRLAQHIFQGFSEVHSKVYFYRYLALFLFACLSRNVVCSFMIFWQNIWQITH